MKMKIYDEKDNTDLILRLVPNPSGDGISLVAVDENGLMGEASCIATVRDDGSLRIHSRLDSGLPLQRDSEGRIVVVKV